MKKPIFICLAVLSFLHTLASQDALAQGVIEIDPVQVSPEIFSVLLENEYVRVIRYELAPGEKDQWHTHPPKVSYVVAGGKLRITTAGGESFVVDEKADTASWMDNLGRHYAENIGKTPVRILLVEVKAANSDPE